MTTNDFPTGSSEISHLRVVPLLLPIAKHFRTILDLALQDIGLEVGQDHFLLAIDEGSMETIGKVADRLGVRPSTLSKMTDKLAAKGLVRRGRLVSDARATVVSLTDEGMRMQAEVRRVHEVMNEELSDAFGPDGHVETLQALAIFSALLTKRLSRLR